MDGLFLYLPASVRLTAIAQILGSSHEVQDQTRDARFPQVVVVGPANVYAWEIDESDNGGCWPSLPGRTFGDFVCVGFFSSDFARIAEVVVRVIGECPALVDDDADHVFAARDFAAWTARHPAPSWADFEATALLEIPVLETYSCDDAGTMARIPDNGPAG